MRGTVTNHLAVQIKRALQDKTKMEYKVFNRGNILVKLYKMFTKNNKKLCIQITEQVDYEHLRSTLNNYLREDQEISQEEILLINRGRDPLLTFMVLLFLPYTKKDTIIGTLNATGYNEPQMKILVVFPP